MKERMKMYIKGNEMKYEISWNEREREKRDGWIDVYKRIDVNNYYTNKGSVSLRWYELIK